MRQAIFALAAVTVLTAASGCCCLEKFFCCGGCNSCAYGHEGPCGGCGDGGCDGGCGGGGCGGGGCSDCGMAGGPGSDGGFAGGPGGPGGNPYAAAAMRNNQLAKKHHPAGGHPLMHQRRNAGGEYEFAAGPPTGGVSYPYYTNRGPRDFLAKNPRGIGP